MSIQQQHHDDEVRQKKLELVVDPVPVVRRQPDLSRVLDPRHVPDPRDVLPATPEPHVAVVGRVDEPAAEAHVHAAQDHDAAGNGGKEDELKLKKVYF